jgi:AraC family transcriptional regulator of adaptative response / DNA-3-methyladenine glycosylase II
MFEDRELWLRAVQSRDSRFDGWFFTAVTSTGIYCRPSCPAMTPKPGHIRFFPSAAAAQSAGFRACKRCRPDAVPGSPEWDLRADLAGRAMRLIADGVVEREGVGGLAGRLGYSPRQLERHLREHVGAGPLALSRAQRAQTARTLIETTTMAMGDVAFAAGFGSIRQFNDTIRMVFAQSPSELRGRGTPDVSSPAGTIEVRLPFRSPLFAPTLLDHLRAAGVAGLEEWRDGSYRRTLRLPRGGAIVALTPAPTHIGCRLHLSDVRDLAPAIARCRRLLDLDADPVAVDDTLGLDPALAGVVAAAPGRRVPRTVDEAEMAVRIVIGQQVSVSAARRQVGRLVELAGDEVADPSGGLRYLFPTPEGIAELDPSSLGLPGARRDAVVGMARALRDGRIDLDPGSDRQAARAGLGALAGIGPWTVEMIAMRSLGDPDAFPVGDLGVGNGARRLGFGASEASLFARSQTWRPWRSYAVAHLWAVAAQPMSTRAVPTAALTAEEVLR